MCVRVNKTYTKQVPISMASVCMFYIYAKVDVVHRQTIHNTWAEQRRISSLSVDPILEPKSNPLPPSSTHIGSKLQTLPPQIPSLVGTWNVVVANRKVNQEMYPPILWVCAAQKMVFGRCVYIVVRDPEVSAWLAKFNLSG